MYIGRSGDELPPWKERTAASPGATETNSPRVPSGRQPTPENPARHLEAGVGELGSLTA